MLADFISHIASHTGLSPKQSRAALGLFLDAADRQGADLARRVFESMPGARTLAAEMAAESGGSSGSIARLIERTPGGRTVVIEKLVRALQAQGLGTSEIGALFPAVASFLDSEVGSIAYGHLGDLLGSSSLEGIMARQTGETPALQKITVR